VIALFTRRRRYVSAHRIVEAALPFFYELAELLDAIGVITGDQSWFDEAWEKFRNARYALLERSDASKKLIARVHEAKHVDEMLRELERHPEIVALIRARPRRPMARVLAARLLRRR